MRYGQLTHEYVFLLNEKYSSDSNYCRKPFNSKIFFMIVLILLKIKMEGALRIQVIHVVGTGMIAQCTDEL